MSITLQPNTRGPVLELTLPASAEAIDIVLRNKSTGKMLILNLPAAWAGDDLILDWRLRTIRDQNGVDRSALLDVVTNALWLATTPFEAGSSNVDIEAVKPFGTLTPELVTAPLFAVGVATDATYVYWADEGSGIEGTIGRAKLNGTEVNNSFIKLIPARPQSGIAVNATHIFWNSAGGAIGRALLNGTSPNAEFLTTPTAALGLALDATYLYWGEDSGGGSIGRAKIGGTEPNAAFITAATQPMSPTVDANYIYWVESGQYIARAKINGTEAEPDFLIPGVPALIRAVTVDANYIYFAAEEYLGRARLDGSELVTRKVGGAYTQLRQLSIRNSFLYWARLTEGLVGRGALAPVDSYVATATLRWAQGYY